MNKRNRLIWNLLIFLGSIVGIYFLFVLFIYSSNLKWSTPGSQNKTFTQLGGYFKYAKDATINAESANKKSYEDFEQTVENLEKIFSERKNKTIGSMRDPMNPARIKGKTGKSGKGAKAGYVCTGISTSGDNIKIVFIEFNGIPKTGKIGDKIGHGTITNIVEPHVYITLDDGEVISLLNISINLDNN